MDDGGATAVLVALGIEEGSTVGVAVLTGPVVYVAVGVLVAVGAFVLVAVGVLVLVAVGVDAATHTMGRLSVPASAPFNVSVPGKLPTPTPTASHWITTVATMKLVPDMSTRHA